jgi:hypothetical protein
MSRREQAVDRNSEADWKDATSTMGEIAKDFNIKAPDGWA